MTSLSQMPGTFGFDRLELAANVGRRIGLRVPDIDVARPALEEDHDDRFGLAPAAFGLVTFRQIFGQRLQTEDVAEAQAQDARAADAEKFTAAEAVAGAARQAGNG